MEEWFSQPSIIWSMMTRRSKAEPTVREAAMEAETLLTNYLVDEKFPQGSDCHIVRDMLRRALKHRQSPLEKVIGVQSTLPYDGTGVYRFHLVEVQDAPEGHVYFLPKGIAEAIYRGDAKVLKV